MSQSFENLLLSDETKRLSIAPKLSEEIHNETNDKDSE